MTVASPIPVDDGYANLVANIGTERDKAAAGGYLLATPDQAQLDAVYRTSPIARKVVDLPAEDAAREWREWQAEAEQIGAIEAEEARLGLVAAVIRGLKAARLRGGAALYIGIEGQDPARPLRPETIRKGGLSYVAVLGRDDLTPGDLQRDPRLPKFGLPTGYTLSAGSAAAVAVHPSRLVVLTGEEVPAGSLSATDAWGDSALWAAQEAIRNLDSTAANIASLIFEAKVDVLSINGLTEKLRTPGYEDLLLRRFSLAAVAKGINGMMILDGEEEHSTRTADFAGLPEIVDRFMQLASAAASIPMTRLFGRSPAGLNATGESDTRDYYDRIRVMQSLEIGPAMAVLDECLIRSALGVRPPDVWYSWRPLWQPSAKERADVARTQAEVLKIAAEVDALSGEALSRALVNALTESGAFPGLEAAVAEFPLDDPDEEGT